MVDAAPAIRGALTVPTGSIRRMKPTLPRCRIVYDDDWQPELAAALRHDPAVDALQRGLEELAGALGELVDRPDNVLLVVAVGLASAVQRRQPDVPYHTERGSGAVAARTMQRPDGRIEVVIETGFIVDVDASGQGRATPAGLPRLHRGGLDTMKSTIVHEAQHVNMHQRNSDWGQFETDAHERDYPRWDYTVAAKVIDEYRAEWNATQHPPRRPPPAVKDVLDVLEQLGKELAAADATYQQSPSEPDSVEAFREAVYSACASFWTAMSYWAADFRGNQQDVSSEIAGLALWQRYVGATWAKLLAVLDAVPVEDLDTHGDALRASAAQVAVWVAESLNHIGFRHTRTEEVEAFYIDRHDFPNARE